MLKAIARWCDQAFKNAFLFERRLSNDEWDAVNSGDPAQMRSLLQDALDSSHNVIRDYILAQEGFKEYCRTHILPIGYNEEYAKAILTHSIPGPYTFVNEYRMYKSGTIEGRYCVVEEALKNAEFGVVMLMFEIKEFFDALMEEGSEKKHELMMLAVKSFSKESEPILKKLLDAGCDIDCYSVSAYGSRIVYSNLRYSIEEENRELFDFLIAEGADVKLQRGEVKGLRYDDYYYSPLGLAVKKGLTWAVRELLERGVDANSAVGVCGAAPLSVAFKHINENTSEIIRLLLKYGASPSAGKPSPFYCALENTELQREHLEILFEAHPNLYIEGNIIGDGTKISNIPKSEYKGQSPKGSGTVSYQSDFVTVTTFPKASLIPLDTAIRRDNVVAVEFFLDHGLCGLDTRYLTSSSNEDQEIYQYPLFGATEHGSIKTLRLLLERGADMYLEDNDGHRAIEWCRDKENIQCFESKGYDIRTEISRFGTLLMAVIERYDDNFDMVRYVCTKSDLDAQNHNGVSALHIAASNFDHGVVTYLIQSGARVDLVDLNGRTPLHYAAEPKEPYDEEIVISKKIITIANLLAYGSSLNRADHSGITALDLLEGSGNIVIKPYLDFLKRCQEVYSTIKPDIGLISLFGGFNEEIVEELIPEDALRLYNARLDSLEKAFSSEGFTGQVVHSPDIT